MNEPELLIRPFHHGRQKLQVLLVGHETMAPRSSDEKTHKETSLNLAKSYGYLPVLGLRSKPQGHQAVEACLSAAVCKQ
jgi:hypothetical protein